MHFVCNFVFGNGKAWRSQQRCLRAVKLHLTEMFCYKVIKGAKKRLHLFFSTVVVLLVANINNSSYLCLCQNRDTNEQLFIKHNLRNNRNALIMKHEPYKISFLLSWLYHARIRAVNGSDAVLSDLTATDVRNRRRYTWKRTRAVNWVHNDTVLSDLAVPYVKNMGSWVQCPLSARPFALVLNDKICHPQ